jgi:hypothetical protein
MSSFVVSNIGGQFSLSPQERAGVRENRSNWNAITVHGRPNRILIYNFWFLIHFIHL